MQTPTTRCTRNDCRAWKEPNLCKALIDVADEGSGCKFYKTVSQYELERERLKMEGRVVLTPEEYRKLHEGKK